MVITIHWHQFHSDVEGNDGDGADNPGDGKLERKIFFFFPLSEDASLF